MASPSTPVSATKRTDFISQGKKATPKTPTTPKTSTKRKVLTVEDRIRVLELHEKGESAKKISVTMGCGKTQIQNIIKDKVDLKANYVAGKFGGERKYLKPRRSLYAVLNQEVFDWFCGVRAKDMPVTGTLIKEKAQILTLEKDGVYDLFTASNGWLESWRKQFNIKSLALSGESNSVDPAILDDWASRLPTVLEGYELKDVFNADETGLYYRTLPSRSLVHAGESGKGIRTSKDRITVLLCCSAAGEKVKPLVIGRTQNPRCFRAYGRHELGVGYEFNSKAWMTSKIFRTWLESVNNKMRIQGRHILLLVDNCAAHPPYELSNIKVSMSQSLSFEPWKHEL